MMMMRVIGEEHLRGLFGLAARFRIGVTLGAHTAGQILVRTTQQGMIQGPQTGRVYPGQRRQSSAPGQYPAVQTGQLLGSIEYQVQGSSQLEFGSRGAFNGGFDYAQAQQLGTSKMAPRPYLTLTVNKTRDRIAKILGDSIYAQITGGGA